MKHVSVGAIMRVLFFSLSLSLFPVGCFSVGVRAVALLVVMYGESDQGLQVLRAAAVVCVCVSGLIHAVVLVNTSDVITQLFPLAHLW